MGKSLDFRKNLRRFLIENLEKLLAKNYEKLKEFINERIESEKSYINYDDNDFFLLKPYILTDEDPDSTTVEHLQK